MKLIFTDSDKAHQDIFDRMKTMVLAFEREASAKESDIVLEDGSISYVGVKQVNEHLDVIAGELHNWYYGSC